MCRAQHSLIVISQTQLPEPQNILVSVSLHTVLGEYPALILPIFVCICSFIEKNQNCRALYQNQSRQYPRFLAALTSSSSLTLFIALFFQIISIYSIVISSQPVHIKACPQAPLFILFYPQSCRTLPITIFYFIYHVVKASTLDSINRYFLIQQLLICISFPIFSCSGSQIALSDFLFILNDQYVKECEELYLGSEIQQIQEDDCYGCQINGLFSWYLTFLSGE